MTAFAARYARHPYAIASIIVAILFLCALPVKAQVPVSLMPIPRQQFLSASGQPLAGGLVYTYVAGTSTPAPTYLDYTGTSLNTNPITLDAGGFAAIWIPSAPIDVAVFNSSGTQQYKVLNVTALAIRGNELNRKLLPIQQHQSRSLWLPADGKQRPSMLA